MYSPSDTQYWSHFPVAVDLLEGDIIIFSNINYETDIARHGAVFLEFQTGVSFYSTIN